MVDRGHTEHPTPPEQPVATHLEDDRNRLDHEQPGHDWKQQMGVGSQSQGGQAGPDGQRPRVSHEDPGWGGVPPQKAQATPGHRRGDHRQIQGVGHVVGLRIPELPKTHHRVGTEAERPSASGQSVQAVREVHRVG